LSSELAASGQALTEVPPLRTVTGGCAACKRLGPALSPAARERVQSRRYLLIVYSQRAELDHLPN